jgi:fumarate reductase flavoprotein subunit
VSTALLDLPREVALETEVAIVGAGGAGLSAALAAREAGAEVWLFERDPLPRGSTAMSSGMIPAAGTRFQKARGIDDDPERFAADILAKNGGANAAMAHRLAGAAAATVERLVDRWGVRLELVEGFLYPGHSRPRMHAPPSRSGEELVGALLAACEDAGAVLVNGARVEALFVERGRDGAIARVAGLLVRRGKGSEAVRARAVVLACCGFAGARDLVRRHVPEMAEAPCHGHPGNEGDALRWGEALGAALADLDAYQGHAGLAVPHGILVTWAIVSEGGIQVDLGGERFADESLGYSEQAARLLARPGGLGWILFDTRRRALARAFEDFRRAEALGAIREAADRAELAALTGLPPAALARTLDEVEACARGERADRFGRDFTRHPPLAPPFCAVKVTGALFHTQGGLEVDGQGRVLRPDGTVIEGLYAAGGAARGVSGRGAAGYLSGNGLLSAIVLGRIAGKAAALSVRGGAHAGEAEAPVRPAPGRDDR